VRDLGGGVIWRARPAMARIRSRSGSNADLGHPRPLRHVTTHPMINKGTFVLWQVLGLRMLGLVWRSFTPAPPGYRRMLHGLSVGL
jgi:hypothetical protein